MTAIDTAFALVFVSLGGIIAFFVALAGRAIWNENHPNEMAMCTPTRRANITASVPQTHAERRIALLGLIEATPLAAQPVPVMEPQPQRGPTREEIAAAVCAPSRYDVLTMQRQHSLTYDLASLTAPATPELPPVVPVVEPQEEQGIPVPDWPTPVTTMSATISDRRSSCHL